MEKYSPNSSPRGSRSPVIPRQDSTGTLKATISLGKNPSIVHTGPFYLIKESPTESELTGATNLMAHYGLEHAYNKSNGRKIKDTLSSFLPHFPGKSLVWNTCLISNSGLRAVIDKPPIGGKEFLPLSSLQLSGFRLHPGPLPEVLRNTVYTAAPKKKHKHKKRKHKEMEAVAGYTDATAPDSSAPSGEKKHRRQKRHEDDKERKKRKKEKKKKKQKHSPEPSSSAP